LIDEYSSGSAKACCCERRFYKPRWSVFGDYTSYFTVKHAFCTVSNIIEYLECVYREEAGSLQDFLWEDAEWIYADGLGLEQESQRFSPYEMDLYTMFSSLKGASAIGSGFISSKQQYSHSSSFAEELKGKLSQIAKEYGSEIVGILECVPP
jgi:hypothetical protein